ncbi:MAG: thioredoxin domain-containing protein [Alphaproteobacteria bacterium]|nr:thioredoxin domain-containing protein [Alphaproteobacteria bacterium]
MKNFSIILSTVAIILATVAIVSVFKVKSPVVTAAPMAVADGVVSQSDLASVLSQNPKIVADALQAYEQQQREAQEKAAAELLAKYAGEISSEANVPFIGPKDAKVTVTEFFDFSCGYCKRLSPEIEKIIADNADVKFVFKPLTFVSPVSSYQAKAGFAAFNQGKFLEFYKAVMEGDASSEELVDEIAKNAGIDFDKYKADVASDEVSKRISDVAAFAQKIQVNGVPAVFINGKQAHGRSAAELQADIDAAK